jgi:hypothetical protein
MGKRTASPRDHLIKVMLRLSTIEDKFADKGYVADVVRKSLGGFPPPNGKPDQRTFIELSVANRVGKTRTLANVVVGVEGSAPWSGRPKADSVEGFCDALLGEGYRVEIREKRECAEAACPVAAMVDWNRPAEIPAGWYSSLICGRHNYRTCVKCHSVYVLTSTNAAGQAPSVACKICGTLMIGWGGSKVWTADLVKKGVAPS